MKSVAYVTTTFPTLAAFVENEVHRLLARGVRVRVVTLGKRGRLFQPEHAPLLDVTREIGAPLHPAAWLALITWLMRRPAVLLGEWGRMLWASRASPYALAGHLGYLPAAARLATLIEREGLERVHGAWAHFPASVAYLAARLTGRPFSMSGHAGADLYRTRAFLAEKVRAAEFVSACVRQNADLLRDLGGKDARVHWIYHGVDRRRFDGRGRSRDPEPLLMAVGRLARPKGFDLAIEAVARLRGRGMTARLVVVGDGPERQALRDLARTLGVDALVTFSGALTHDALLPLYRRAWLLVAPSRIMANGRRDGIPNVVVEALAMGLPCVGTRAAGLEEAIEPGITGALAAPDDADALASAIEPLLRDPGRIDAMAAHTQERVAEAFDAERNFERLYALMANGGTP